MKDNNKASTVFRTLSEAMRPASQGEHAVYIAKMAGRSHKSINHYAMDPDRKHFRAAPAEVLDRMLEKVMHEDVHRPSTLRAMSSADAFLVLGHSLDDYLSALDLADRMKVSVVMKGAAVIPEISWSARLRHQWRQVYFAGHVDKADLATIAGVDAYDVRFVGREHPKLGIQPTSEQVQAAIALEAMVTGRKAA